MIDRRANSTMAALATLFILAGCSSDRTPDENTAEAVADQASNMADAAPLQVPPWIRAQAGPSRDCPLSGGAATPDNPYFEFNGTTDAPDFNCRQTGPFEWGGKTWYVQRIHSLTTSNMSPKCAENGFTAPCLFDGTRTCSAQAKAGDPTPAGSNSGGKGCGVYAASEKFRKKP